MSKLVIYTQYYENYGIHDWDGNGPVPQRWKSKFGDVHVVENLSDRQISQINTQGIPTLISLIEYSNDSSREDIASYKIVDDNHEVCEDWESPYILEYDNNCRCWNTKKVEKNDGQFRHEIDSKVSTKTLRPGGESENYVAMYYMKSGEILTYGELQEYYRENV